MAEDARISTDFPLHYKTKKVKRRLGVEGCWHLMCLFLWAASNRPEGNLSGMSDEDVEIACGWEGKVGEFTSVLAEVGYLDGDSGNRVIHDWAIHNVYAATRHKRVEAAKRAISIRWGKRTGNAENTGSIRSVYAENENAIPSSPLLSTPLNTKTLSSNGTAPFDGISSKASPEEAEAVTKVWHYYLAQTGRNEKTYSFSKLRKQKGLARFREALATAGGDYARASELLTIAIDCMIRSDWHMGRDPATHGKRYVEWDKHLFASREQLERWWQRNDES